MVRRKGGCAREAAAVFSKGQMEAASQDLLTTGGGN
jgi:hypothetical protein